MNRRMAFLLCAALVACMLTGCSQSARPGQADDEILTYERVDPKKTTLTVSTLGNNASIRSLSEAFEAKYPDVQVVEIDITGGNADYKPVLDWIADGLAPDVMFLNADSFTDEAFVMEHFENLSTNAAVSEYEAEALNRLAINGSVYLLPAPSTITCMTYNKTLFEQYGWKTPKTFDEFVALCVRIREDTNGEIQPWNPNAKYDSSLTIVLEAFVYERVFAGLDNYSWYMDFRAGKATFEGHMEPLYEAVRTLADNGLFLEEHFTYSTTTRGKEFLAGKIAMINGPAASYNNAEYEFDLLPFPTTGDGLGYVNDYYSSLIGVPKKERTAKQKDAVDRYIAFLSSVEGQQAMIGSTLMVSNVKNVPLGDEEALAGIREAIAAGHLFGRLDFEGDTARTWTFQGDALAMTKGEKTAADCIAAIDAEPYVRADPADEPPAVLASVTENMTVLETSFFYADAYRKKADADIGLINHGIAYRGNLIRLFAGDLLENQVTVLKPRSFENNSTLVRASMTGRQILDALNHPVGNDCVSDSVYAFSGLKCKIAPWKPLGEKYVEVKLADGSPLDMDTAYSVAFWAGTVSDEYVTEITDTYEGTWEEFMTAALREAKTVSPAADGRATLVWN